ncbi:MAG: DUF3169 family protein [Cellulosilyticaceae bacterium]
MKDYKWGKFSVMLVVWGFIGACAGYAMNWLGSNSSPESIAAVCNQLAPNLFWVAFACGIIGLLGYVYFNHLFKKDGYSNEEGSLYDRYENRFGIVMTFATVGAIVNFTAFGVNLLNDISPIYFGMFIINVIIAFMGEVSNISIVKKVRPELNADPVDSGFKQDYFDKLDEFEKIKMGKVCFKTVSAMVPVYVGVFVVCWFLIMALEVSPIICVPVGIIWFFQTVITVYHSCKFK